MGVGDGLEALDRGLAVLLGVVAVGRGAGVAVLRPDRVQFVDDLGLLAQRVDGCGLRDCPLALEVVVAHSRDLEELPVDVGVRGQLLRERRSTSLLSLREKPLRRSWFSSNTVLIL